jgi:hypothetical protein
VQFARMQAAHRKAGRQPTCMSYANPLITGSCQMALTTPMVRLELAK